MTLRDIGIAKVVQHPLWNKRTLANDIAILALASKVEFRPGVVPACMPDEYRGRLGYNKQAVAKTEFWEIRLMVIARNLTTLLSSPSPTITGWGATFVGGGTVSRFVLQKIDDDDQDHDHGDNDDDDVE